MNAAIKNQVKKIATKIQRISEKSPGDQMAIYLELGVIVDTIAGDWSTYGDRGIETLIRLVHELPDARHLYAMRDYSMIDEEFEKYVICETNIPMANGQFITLEHWTWLNRLMPRSSWPRLKDWFDRVLAWLRKESLPVSVLEFVDELIHERDSPKLKELYETIRKASKSFGKVESASWFLDEE